MIVRKKVKCKCGKINYVDVPIDVWKNCVIRCANCRTILNH